MILDDLQSMAALDAQDYYRQITGLPDQLRSAWELGMSLPLPSWQGIERVLIAGMGGSAIGADLVAEYVSPHCNVPIVVQRDYDLPAWAAGKKTLVIASSHSGNTEETLSAFTQASQRGCSLLALTTGGRLAELAQQQGAGVWRFTHAGMPRAAVGYSFGLLLAALRCLDIIPDPDTELQDAYHQMARQLDELGKERLAVQNPAKRLAGQLMGCFVTVIGAGLMVPVARRWKGQFNELAKTWASYDALPEADHNTLAGSIFPEDDLVRQFVLFLQSPSDPERNRLRLRLTRRAFMLQGLSTDEFTVQGNTRLAQLWSGVIAGDLVAYFLAIAYGVDPTPIAPIENFKSEMRSVA